MKHHRYHSSKKKIFSKQFLGKHTFHIRQPKDTNLFGRKIRYLIYGLILVSFGVVFFNVQPDSNTNIHVFIPEEKSLQTTYIFYAQNGENYNIFGQQDIHGAPQSWEYLFEGVDLS
ncbi:MAG: hypothetical protein LBD75_05755 [Candidatus Peribacteria bacterium]|jgi:hypothetical protein|nr:hypothetical protein [Candidatus Peribacteria bacterium]